MRTVEAMSTVTTAASTRTSVEVLVDPICPFAWITSRWLVEVASCRDVDVTFGLMSLSVLNEGRDDLSDFYRALVEDGWGPARVAVAVDVEFGQTAFRRFYEAFGQRHHVGDQPLGSRLLESSLSDAGLPDRLANTGSTDEFDVGVRSRHAAAVALVGEEVGTPVLRLQAPDSTPVGIFGPVVTPCPRGEAAGRLWDAVVIAATTPGFFELKRSRTRPLSFD